MSDIKGIKGLASIKKYQEEQKAAAALRDRPKAAYFKWPDGVTVATATFVQELDESATGYKEENGLGGIYVEWEAPGPNGFQRRALCTLETEGKCYPYERRQQDPTEGWKQKRNLYINALVDYGQGKGPELVVISRNANSSFAEQLIQEAIDEDTITDKQFRITKTGTGKQTNWLLKPLPKEAPFELGDKKVFNIEETVLRHIPYSEQAAYFGQVWSGSGPVEESEHSKAVSEIDPDAAW